MRKYWFVGFAVVLALGIATTAWAQSTGDRTGSVNPRSYEGLWQAIDSFDGSTQLVSITCASADDCDVRLNDTAFTLTCDDQIGFAHGTGSIEDGVLVVNLSLSCSNRDGTSEAVGSQVNEFVYDRDDRTLLNLNDDPMSLSNVFHKISR